MEKTSRKNQNPNKGKCGILEKYSKISWTFVKLASQRVKCVKSIGQCLISLIIELFKNSLRNCAGVCI